MNYTLIAIGCYLVVGIFLTHVVLRLPRQRLKFRDIVLGAVAMPVLFVALLVLTFLEDAWKRLLIVLDYNPPEEMRAGPKPKPDADGLS
jgi:hypothetical protein